ncbi:hypothetical protein ACFLTZ_01730 [Chloroflexota bacterium]
MSQLPVLVEALLDPKAYPETTQGVELAQTQMSFVFLADNYVYKIKKPVNLGFLDYTTLEQRQFYCHQEVELNRRLCHDVYIGVVAVTQGKGGITIEGQGEIIEYSVKMRRLPKTVMMDVLLSQNKVTSPMVSSVAQKLVGFHQKAETNDSISAFGSLDNITQNTEENFSQTIKYIGNTISQEKYRNIQAYTRGFIEKNVALFHGRIAGGRIRDCHGDLHAAHICFADDIYIYDCIEFNDRFRYCDIASEIAFLAMDIDHYGQADLSQSFANAYVDMSHDEELLKLLGFYKCYRAYVRGKVESFKLDDPHISAEEKARILIVARRYFELAGSYIV